jgi:hypothetical protein
MLDLCVILFTMLLRFSTLYKIQGSDREMVCVKSAFVNPTSIFPILSGHTVFYFTRNV